MEEKKQTKTLHIPLTLSRFHLAVVIDGLTPYLRQLMELNECRTSFNTISRCK
jgi:hypothetical protein